MMQSIVKLETLEQTIEGSKSDKKDKKLKSLQQVSITFLWCSVGIFFVAENEAA